MTLRVAVFDHHPVVHTGLTSLLPQHGFSVVCQAFDGHEALEKVTRANARIVITDIQLPHLDGLRVLELLADSGRNISSLVYASHDNPTYLARAIALGASDFVLKTEPLSLLIHALANLTNQVPPAATSLFSITRAKLRNRRIETGNPHGLTDRELQVLRHLGYGLSNREIARSLEISVETVKEHVQNILRKQDSSDRTQAAVWAVRSGLAW